MAKKTDLITVKFKGQQLLVVGWYTPHKLSSNSAELPDEEECFDIDHVEFYGRDVTELLEDYIEELQQLAINKLN